MKHYLLAICLLLLSACANLPPAIEDPPLFDLSYNQATQDIAHFKNAPVRWGGVVIDVENEQNASFVKVLYYPLNRYGRPQLDEPSAGRFLFTSTEFLDPAIYTKDTEITVAGTIAGDVERTVGRKTLRLPLILSTTIHLWPAYVQSNYYGYGGYGGYGWGDYGGGYPYWGGYGGYGYYPYWGGYYRSHRH